MDLDAQPFERPRKLPGQVRFDARKQLGEQFHDRDLDPDSCEELSELAAAHPPAEDQHRPRQGPSIEELPGVHHGRSVGLEPLQDGRNGSGGDHRLLKIDALMTPVQGRKVE